MCYPKKHNLTILQMPVKNNSHLVSIFIIDWSISTSQGLEHWKSNFNTWLQLIIFFLARMAWPSPVWRLTNSMTHLPPQVKISILLVMVQKLSFSFLKVLKVTTFNFLISCLEWPEIANRLESTKLAFYCKGAVIFNK